MPTLIRSLTEREVLLDWAKAEIATKHLAHSIPAQRLRLKIESNVTLSFEEESILVAEISHARSAMLEWILSRPTVWNLVKASVHELAAVQADIWWLQNQQVHARTLLDLAREPVHTSIPGFSPQSVRGHLILVAPDLATNPLLIEGAHRAAEFLRIDPATRPTEFELILGVCPTITQWARWIR